MLAKTQNSKLNHNKQGKRFEEIKKNRFNRYDGQAGS